MNKRSLYKALTINLAITSVIILLLGSLTYYSYLSQLRRSNIEKSANDITESIVNAVEIPLWNLDKKGVEKSLHLYLQNPDIAGIDLKSDVELSIRNEMKDASVMKRVHIEKRALDHEGYPLGELTVYFDRTPDRSDFWNTLAFVIVFFFLLVLLVLAGIRLIVKLYVKGPNNAITEVIKSITEGCYDIEVPSSRYAEPDLILRNIAHMKREILRRDGSLRDSERKYRTLNNTMPLGVFILDKDGAILDANLTAEEMYGYTKEEFIAERRYFIMNDTYSEEKPLFYVSKSINGPEQSFDGIMRRKDGTEFPCLIRMKRVAEDGKDHVIMTVSDISHLKALEKEREELRHQFIWSEKLAMIGQMTSSVVHEMRNIMTVILGNSQIMAQRTEKDSETQRCLKDIRDVSEKALGILGEVLTFSRNEDRKKEDIDLNGIISEYLSVLELLVKKKASLEFIPGDNVGSINCIPGSIENIIVNLVMNARDAVSDKGRIEIATSVEGARKCIRISDNGCGLDKEDIKKIFLPFYTTKERGRGTGLGLSVVMQIVKQHGGTIDVNSEKGSGTTFRIFF